MLKGLDADVLKMIQEIIKSKSRKKDGVIFIEDIKGALTPKAQEAAVEIHAPQVFGSAEQDSLACTVLLDPTPKVNTGEGVPGYTALFSSRFEKSMKILSQRPDSRRIAKVASVKQTMRNGKLQLGNENPRGEHPNGNNLSGESIIVAGLVMFRRAKKNGAVDLEIDDYTGVLTASAISDEAKRQVSSLSMDQLVMLELENAKGVPGLAIRSAVSPDIPDHLPNRSRSESYAVLISDLHVGSKFFMRAEFLKFLEWLSSTDDDIIRKIRYLCVGGDLIDGIGIFPNQDKELLELDTAKQMAHAAEVLSKVPKHIKMLVIPGNHDPGRRALPQPALPGIEAEGLRRLENCVMLGNPAFVQLDGVKILMYHGQSLDDVIATTPGLSYSRPAEAMKVLLKARHLAPMYGGRTPIAPESEDMMVISEVPDIFHSGHVHVTDIQNYKGTLVVNSGAWQSQTKFQQTMGIMPTPGIAIMVNLATLQPTMQDFVADRESIAFNAGAQAK